MVDNEKTRVLVFMKEKAELDDVRGNPQLVLQKLKTVAQKSQRQSLLTISSLQNESKVPQYRSFWIVNCISVTGTKGAIKQLVKSRNVDKIIEDPVIPLPSPAVSLETETTPRSRRNARTRRSTGRARRSPCDARLPPLTLLEAGKLAQVTAKEINLAAGLIEKTLADFGLPVRVVDFRSGPSVTQFAVEPGYLEHPGPDGEIRRSKVRVSQISALANDLALALSAPRLRIEAPVPGHAYVGIEVPLSLIHI